MKYNEDHEACESKKEKFFMTDSEFNSWLYYISKVPGIKALEPQFRVKSSR